MLNTVFYLLLAGCTEGSGACDALSAPDTAFPTAAACERVLVDHLSQPNPRWPVMHAICVPGQPGQTADAPANWPAGQQTLRIAQS